MKISISSRQNQNSLGQPIAKTKDEVEKFWKWFGNSKAVDKLGRPLVCYHGTNMTFDKFDDSKIGKSNDKGYLGRGFYFSTCKQTAHSYGNNVKAYYLKLDNPMIDAFYTGIGYGNEQYGNGQDGAIYTHENYDMPGISGCTELCVKTSKQIRLIK